MWLIINVIKKDMYLGNKERAVNKILFTSISLTGWYQGTRICTRRPIAKEIDASEISKHLCHVVFVANIVKFTNYMKCFWIVILYVWYIEYKILCLKTFGYKK